MTNLIASKKKKEIINPENSLLFTPIIIGVLLLTSTLAFIYRPLIKKLAIEEAQIKVLNEKISYIPIYKRYINELSINTSMAKKQQERLIQLIADPQELNTILSEINRISIDNQIEIIQVVPKPIIKYNKSNNTTTTDINNNSSSVTDPFLVPSIEKHIFKLTLKGEFNRLIDFLKELELLQAITISDDIEIKPSGTTSNEKRSNLTMSLNLTTYAEVSTKNDNLNNKNTNIGK
tara:strand:+ start:48 stop:749 length:702 start_codon:yes stop_codon:yes gene_type:complete